jgi:hypothetical protein
MANLFDPPPVFELPFSKGGDLYFEFEYMPVVVDVDNNPVLDSHGNFQYAVADYPPGTDAVLVVEADGADIEVDGVIDGSIATFWKDKAFVGPDVVSTGGLWRLVLTFSDGLDKAICNGKVKRYDVNIAT